VHQENLLRVITYKDQCCNYFLEKCHEEIPVHNVVSASVSFIGVL